MQIAKVRNGKENPHGNNYANQLGIQSGYRLAAWLNSILDSAAQPGQ